MNDLPQEGQPTLKYECQMGWPSQNIAGVDEVGRGPLAGDVFAAAVILPLTKRAWFTELADSKKLREKKREYLHDIIQDECIVGIGRATLNDIAELNILWASMLAMKRAVDLLGTKPSHVLIDGNRLPPGIDLPSTAIIKGDGKSCSIAAASIVAKVTRDREMKKLNRHYPMYGWDRNKGYPSREHREALAKYGPSPYHRRGFKLV